MCALVTGVQTCALPIDDHRGVALLAHQSVDEANSLVKTHLDHPSDLDMVARSRVRQEPVQGSVEPVEGHLSAPPSGPGPGCRPLRRRTEPAPARCPCALR